MKQGYGQYCPLALATELLCRRWTVLVVSRLLDGCRTFNEIHRGIPRISPSLLSKRLGELEHAGLLRRRRKAGRNGRTSHSYHPTEACRELEDVIWNLSVWGQRWARDMAMDDLDPAFLAWSMHLRLDTGAMPPGRTVIQFEFSGAPADCRRFWLLNDDGRADMCLKPPGFETDLLVEADLRRFVETWRGFRKLQNEIRAGHIRLTGPASLRRGFADWLQLSSLAGHRRQYPGRERQLGKAGS